MDTFARTPLQQATLVPASLREALVDAMGPDIGVACSGVDGDPQLLWPEELASIRHAVPRRQREFAAGRTAAREAMTRMGLTPSAIPSAPDRSPIWPNGLVGSIAHNSRACVAVVGQRNQLHAVGIDMEEDSPLDAALWDTICTPEEMDAVATMPPCERGQWVTRLFCAKEAFYKWQYPQTGRMLNFRDVHVAPSRLTSRFCVHRAISTHPPLLTCQCEGRLMIIEGLVLAWLTGAPACETPNERGQTDVHQSAADASSITPGKKAPS